MRPDITYIVWILCRYLCNLARSAHWKLIKRVMRYLQKINLEHMLMYQKYNHLKVIGYLNYDFIGCLNRRSTLNYIFIFIRGIILWKKYQIDINNHFYYRKSETENIYFSNTDTQRRIRYFTCTGRYYTHEDAQSIQKTL